MSSRKAKVRNKPSTKKQVRQNAENNPEFYLSKLPVWKFSDLDIGSEWCPIGNLSIDAFRNEILPKLQNLETMTWKEIINGGSHEIPVESLIRSAKKRLETNLINTDYLFSLRLSGKKRIWGIRNTNVLRLLWWDPEHVICPSFKKHT